MVNTEAVNTTGSGLIDKDRFGRIKDPIFLTIFAVQVGFCCKYLMRAHCPPLAVYGIIVSLCLDIPRWSESGRKYWDLHSLDLYAVYDPNGVGLTVFQTPGISNLLIFCALSCGALSRLHLTNRWLDSHFITIS